MCCANCLLHSDCRARIEIRAHKMAQNSMPNPHYHLCRSATSRTAPLCAFDCRRCGRLIREMPRLSSAQHFAYGCCHRCASYQGCDFVEMHHRVLEQPIGVSGDVEDVPLVEVEPLTTVVLPAQQPTVPAPPA